MSNYKLLADSTLYYSKDNFGGGYFISFFAWWWVPAFASILAVALIPAVPYARRIGARGPFSNLMHKVKVLERTADLFLGHHSVMHHCKTKSAGQSNGRIPAVAQETLDVCFGRSDHC